MHDMCMVCVVCMSCVVCIMICGGVICGVYVIHEFYVLCGYVCVWCVYDMYVWCEGVCILCESGVWGGSVWYVYVFVYICAHMYTHERY